MPALSELSFPAMALNSLSVNELISTARAMTGDYIRSSILMISLHHPVLYQFIVNMDDAWIYGWIIPRDRVDRLVNLT